MDLFVSPEKQRRNDPSVKTPVRRKLIDDDDDEVVLDKKGQSRTTGGGLRLFSVMGLSLSLLFTIPSCFWILIHSTVCFISVPQVRSQEDHYLQGGRYHSLQSVFPYRQKDLSCS